jgi:DNA-binding beta-propeller fold protein YncE
MESHRYLRTSGELIYSMGGGALAPDGSRLYLTGTGPDGWTQSELIAVDTESLEVIWREALTDGGGYRTDRFSGIAVRADHRVAHSANGNLFIGGAGIGTPYGPDYGVAVLDADTRDLVGFLGPFDSGLTNFTVTPPGVSPSGQVLLGVTSDTLTPRNHLRIVDPESLALLDSIPVADLLGDPSADESIWNLVPAPDGSAVYLRFGSGRVARFDLAERAVTAVHASDAPGCLACLSVSPDGSQVVITHTATWDFPAPGRVEVLDADLRPVGEVDLSEVLLPTGAGMGLRPPSIQTAVGGGGQTLVLGVGNRPIILSGEQHARVFFVDPESFVLLDSVSLPGQLYVYRMFGVPPRAEGVP